MNHIGTDLELMQIFETGEVVWLAKSDVWTIINQDTSTLMVWEESSHSVPTSSPLHVSPLTHNCTSKLSFPHFAAAARQGPASLSSRSLWVPLWHCALCSLKH